MAKENYSALLLSNYFIAKRAQKAEPALPRAVLAVAQALATWRSTPPLCYAGRPPRLIEFSELGIATYMTWLKHVNTSGIPKPFSLSSHDWKPELTLHLLPNKDLFFALPSGLNETLLRLNRFMEVVAQVCLGFGAYYGYTNDQRLRRCWQNLVGIEGNRLTSTPLRNVGFPEPLPELLHFSKFDSRLVPDGIWWVNFWDSVIVETIGLERIQSAPWEILVELSEGGVVVAATEEPTDAQNPLHLAKLAQIVEHLGLRRLQERYQVPTPVKE